SSRPMRTRREGSRSTSPRPRFPSGGTSSTSATHPCGPSHPRFLRAGPAHNPRVFLLFAFEIRFREMIRNTDCVVADKLYQKGGFHRLVGHLRTNLAFTAVAIASVLLSGAVLFGYLSTAPMALTLRLGFFPNVTHAQALYGVA